VSPDRFDQVVASVATAARAGVHLVQIRQPALDGGPLFALVQRCVQSVAGTSTRVVVNDRLDVALAGGAHGVHLRGDSMPASRLRAFTPHGFLIGRSVHTVAETVAATVGGGLDYLVFGTTFPTMSKPGRPTAGVGTLAEVCAATSLPVLAVGGVSTMRFADVARSGAAGFAAISLFSHGTDPHAVLRSAHDAWTSASEAV
jgi:thiamine-phosphate diphosphorylase